MTRGLIFSTKVKLQNKVKIFMQPSFRLVIGFPKIRFKIFMQPCFRLIIGFPNLI